MGTSLRTATTGVLLRFLRRRAEAGQPTTMDDLRGEIGGVFTTAHHAVRAAELAGALVVQRNRNGIIRGFQDPAGAWQVPIAQPAPTPKRACLRCRVSFPPRHRHNWLCDACGKYAEANG
jgi:hypothetical protein